jgi:protein-disulfide isomerase/uncharacterized membrane protein
MAGQREGNTYCNISSKFNCDAVTVSPYSQIHGISIASFGAGYYALLFLLTLGLLFASAEPQRSQRYASALGLFTLLAMLYSLAMLYITFALLSAICITCMMIHLINLANLLLVWGGATDSAPLITLKRSLLWPFSGTFGERLRSWAWCFCGIILIVIAILWDRHLYQLSISKALEHRDLFIAQLREQPAQRLDTENSPTKGDPQARLTIVEFSDFACPFCRRAAFLSQAVLHNYKKDVRLVFKNYPLDADCNSHLPQTMHPFACEVARASLCAEKQGKFWDFHDEIFSRLSPFNAKTATESATNVGLDMQNFTTCMQSAETYGKLSRDIDEAARLGIEGTPAFFFNGRKMSGLLPAPILDLLIAETLKLDAPKP